MHTFAIDMLLLLKRIGFRSGNGLNTLILSSVGCMGATLVLDWRLLRAQANYKGCETRLSARDPRSSAVGSSETKTSVFISGMLAWLCERLMIDQSKYPCSHGRHN